jgi:hypothetical protein
MAIRSIYSKGGNGMTTGGLDGYLGPEAQDFSNLPVSIEDPKEVNDVIDVDCKTHPDAAVCQIAAAEKEVESDKHAPESVE